MRGLWQPSTFTRTINTGCFTLKRARAFVKRPGPREALVDDESAAPGFPARLTVLKGRASVLLRSSSVPIFTLALTTL